jgi:putative DNA primase/helicase
MIKFTLYRANCSGNLQNCLYPNEVVVKDKDSFVEAIRFDHVSAKYKDNYRSNTNFLKANNIVLDCDNDHSDDPKKLGNCCGCCPGFSRGFLCGVP